MVRLIIYTFKILLFAAALGALGIHFLLAPFEEGILKLLLIAIILYGIISILESTRLFHRKSQKVNS